MKDDKSLIKVVVGLDGGNNSIKLALEDGEVITYDNIYCKRNDLALEDEYKMNSKRKANKFTIDSMLDVKVTSHKKSNSFIFGKQSEKYRTEVLERVNNFKSDDSQLVSNSIVSLANTVVKKLDPKDWSDNLNVEVSLCTGLPYHEYGNGERKDKYCNLFMGEHSIEFLNPSYPVKKINLNIVNGVVEIEGLAALKQTLLENGIMDLDINELDGKVFVMSDIGCYTTDIVGGIFFIDYDDEGNEFINFEVKSALCQGITNGVGTAIDNTIKRMKKEYASELSQNDSFSRQDIVKAASKDGIVHGTKFSIFPFYEEECRKLGETIAIKFAELYKASGDKSMLDKIYLSGGGTFIDFIVDEFKKTLKTNDFKEELIEIIDNPVYANAKGYLSIASATFGE